MPLAPDAICIMRCARLAELLVDGEPYCIDCADEWLDRMQAIEIYPALRESLPQLGYEKYRQVTHSDKKPGDVW
jgi:hypothetical protein